MDLITVACWPCYFSSSLLFELCLLSQTVFLVSSCFCTEPLFCFFCALYRSWFHSVCFLVWYTSLPPDFITQYPLLDSCNPLALFVALSDLVNITQKPRLIVSSSCFLFISGSLVLVPVLCLVLCSPSLSTEPLKTNLC